MIQNRKVPSKNSSDSEVPQKEFETILIGWYREMFSQTKQEREITQREVNADPDRQIP